MHQLERALLENSDTNIDGSHSTAPKESLYIIYCCVWHLNFQRQKNVGLANLKQYDCGRRDADTELLARLVHVKNRRQFLQYVVGNLSQPIVRRTAHSKSTTTTTFYNSTSFHCVATSVAEWLESRTCDQQVARVGIPVAALPSATLGKLFTHTCASVIKQYNLVPANGQ